MDRRRAALLAIAVIATALGLRAALLSHDLPYYSIDENDIVDPALAFLAGDWRPTWYKYGPLPSYVLAIVLLPVRWVLGPDEFFYRAFFEQTDFYLVARAIHALAIVTAAFLSAHLARRWWGPPAAGTALMLALAPMAELVTQAPFTIRVDTFLGLLALMSLGAAADAVDRGFTVARSATAGLLAGLGMAVKPLTGSLMLPALALALFLGMWPQTEGSTRRRVIAVVASPVAGAMLLGIVAGHVLGNPVSLLEFPRFLREQVGVLYDPANRAGYRWGWDFRWALSAWGLPLLLASPPALFEAFRRRNRPAMVLASYVLVFAGAFTSFRICEYWYNAMLPALLLVVAWRLSVIAAEPRGDRGSRKFVAAIALLLVAWPWYRSILIAADAWFPTPIFERRTDVAADRWIAQHVPPRDTVFLVGLNPLYLPRLLADTPEGEAQWSEHFYYGRSGNAAWRARFGTAYARARTTGRPAYRVLNLRRIYRADPGVQASAEELRTLDRTAMVQGAQWIVTASPTSFRAPWETGPRVEQVAVFNAGSGHVGWEVKIFRMPRRE